MIVYSIWPHEFEDRVHSSLESARRTAKRLLKVYDDIEDVEITRHTMVPPSKANMIYIINRQGGGWSSSSETVETVRRQA